MKPNAKAIAMFTPVLAWLKAGAPHREIGEHSDLAFNMSGFIDEEDVSYTPRTYLGDECGTACCIAGAVEIFNRPNGFQGMFEGVYGVAQALEMDPRDISGLFFATNDDEDAIVSMHCITPAMAAKTLERYMETGIVTWEPDDEYRQRFIELTLDPDDFQVN